MSIHFLSVFNLNLLTVVIEMGDNFMTKPWEAQSVEGTQEAPAPLEIDGRYLDSKYYLWYF